MRDSAIQTLNALYNRFPAFRGIQIELLGFLRIRANADSDRLCRPVVVANAWRSIIGRDKIG